MLNAEKNTVSGIWEIASVFQGFPPASSAALDLSRYGAESPVTQSRVCSAKSGRQRLHSGFSSRPAAAECFNQSQSEIFKPTVLPSWHIRGLFPFLRIVTHTQCFRVKIPQSLCSFSSSTQCFPPRPPAETEPNPPWRRTERGSPLHVLPCTPGTSSPQAAAGAGQTMLGRTKHKQELLGARTGPHADRGAAAEGTHSIHMLVGLLFF